MAKRATSLQWPMEFASPYFLIYYAVPPSLTLWASILLLRRRRGFSTILLLGGSVLYVLMALLTIITSLALQNVSYDSTVWFWVNRVSIWAGMASSSCISLGFLLYALKETNRN